MLAPTAPLPWLALNAGARVQVDKPVESDLASAPRGRGRATARFSGGAAIRSGACGAKLVYAEGFRPAEAGQLFSRVGTEGNPLLEPEQSRELASVASVEVADGFTLRGGGNITRISRLITLDPMAVSDPMFLYKPVNRGTIDLASGFVEAALTSRWVAGFASWHVTGMRESGRHRNSARTSDPNITSLYDLPDLMANRYGPMGLDRPHNFKLDAFRAFELGKSRGAIVAGASFRAQSGIAHNVLAAHPLYGSGESYLLERGIAERSPFTTQLDTRLAYAYPLSKTTKLEAFVSVFNLMNYQKQLNTDENYTFDSANPVIGGSMSDLAHVKTIDPSTGMETNMTPTLNKNYGHTGGNTSLIAPLQQAPRTVQLGARLTFQATPRATPRACVLQRESRRTPRALARRSSRACPRR